ncbi:hypothetical protein F5Y06DRAFT_274708 [Hypoxylon sp. FL0890]|nr:hypothetical protein F5Y06DRAFT_274708 [Hypoxylon sp. FL0890]
MSSSASLDPAVLQAIRNQPALASPNGTIPNFNDPPNNNKLGIAVITVCIILTTLFFLIRCYTRVFYVKKSRLEDYVGFVAFSFFIVGTSELATMTRGIGLFVNQWNIRVEDLEGFLYSYVLVTTLYCVALMLVKVAILLEWTYIFTARSTRNTFFWICYGMIGANCCLYITTIITTNYACTPRERIWRRYIPGSCVDIYALNLSITSIHLIFDLLMLLLPHRIIWTLSLSARQKVGISTVFSVGIMTCACAAGRVASAVNMRYSTDLTYDYSGYLLWGLAETTTAALIFNVPALPIAFRYPMLVPRLGMLLRSKMGALFPQELSSSRGKHQSRPQQPRQGVPPNESPWMDENSEVNLTELDPVRTRSSETKIQHQGGSIHYDGGILKTTEIDIITTENPDTATNDAQRRGPHHPWLDCESD